jgi:hypothetical protein
MPEESKAISSGRSGPREPWVEAGAWLPAEGDTVQRLPVDVIVADRERRLPSGRAAGRAAVVAVAADLTVRLGPGAAGA